MLRNEKAKGFDEILKTAETEINKTAKKINATIAVHYPDFEKNPELKKVVGVVVEEYKKLALENKLNNDEIEKWQILIDSELELYEIEKGSRDEFLSELKEIALESLKDLGKSVLPLVLSFLGLKK